MPRTTAPNKKIQLPGRFEQLVASMPPRATRDDAELDRTLEMIDRLMAAGRLTKGQSLYLETLVQLVEAHEADHHAIETSRIRGIDSLKHLLDENQMDASDLARLLGVEARVGSMSLKGERLLTLDHLRKLARRFKVSPALFVDRCGSTL